MVKYFGLFVLIGSLFITVNSSVSLAAKTLRPQAFPELPPAMAKMSPIDFKGSFMDPRLPRDRGPWFEGWYYRINDKNSQRSLAIIATSYLDPEETFAVTKPMKGYLAVLLSQGPNTPLQVYEYFPQQTHLFLNNKLISQNSKYQEKPSFSWVAEKYGMISAEEVNLTLPDLTIKASFKGRKPWSNEYSDWGPGGLTTYINPVPLKWFVYSLGSQATFEVQNQHGEMVMRGEGYAHQEKNWGDSFPKKWIWMQGIHSDNQAQIAMAGGIVRIAGIDIEKWVLAYKAPGLDITFETDQMNTEFFKKIDGRGGKFEILASDLNYVLKLKAHSSPQQFGLVSIPTQMGYQKNGAKESFSTVIEVEIYKNAFPFTSRSRQLIDRRTFSNAALEFGDQYMLTGSSN